MSLVALVTVLPDLYSKNSGSWTEATGKQKKTKQNIQYSVQCQANSKEC
jgi:hypothetical protein